MHFLFYGIHLMTLSWAEVLTSTANNHNSSSDNELLKKSDDWSWKRWELDNDSRRHQFYSFTWKSLFWFCSSGRGGRATKLNGEHIWWGKKLCEQNNLNFLFIFVSRRIRRWVSTLTFINVSWWTELNCVTKKNVGRSKWISWIWYNKRTKWRVQDIQANILCEKQFHLTTFPFSTTS